MSRKQTWPFILLSILYLGGTLGLFTGYYTAYHRTSFQAQVTKSDKNELTKLFFTDLEYQAIYWTEEGSEFKWLGKMYDVAELTRTKDGYKIICENDSLEELLISFMDMAKGSKSSQGIKKGNPQPQYFAAAHVVAQQVKAESGENTFPILVTLYSSIHPDILSPPPQG